MRLENLDLESAVALLKTAAADVTGDEDERFRRLLPVAAEKAREKGGHWDFLAPAQVIGRLLQDGKALPAGRNLQGMTRLRRVAVARLALDFFKVEFALSETVKSLYPEFFRRLATFLTETARERYEDEYFAKDVRYALGLTVPCGALQFDLKFSIGPKLILRNTTNSGSARNALAYLKCAAWGSWFNEHLDLRAMREFNPDGWTTHCARMAEVLELNPNVRGIVGIGWFYDPAVAEISPNLAYIQKTQLKYGAFLVRVGTAPNHIENALYRSALRRRLYEEGKYLPTCYLLAWPQRELIAWAERLKSDPSVGFAPHDTSATPIPAVLRTRAESTGNLRAAAQGSPQ